MVRTVVAVGRFEVSWVIGRLAGSRGLDWWTANNDK